jgi:hypothetical protein
MLAAGDEAQARWTTCASRLPGYDQNEQVGAGPAGLLASAGEVSR